MRVITSWLAPFEVEAFFIGWMCPVLDCQVLRHKCSTKYKVHCPSQVCRILVAKSHEAWYKLKMQAAFWDFGQDYRMLSNFSAFAGCHRRCCQGLCGAESRMAL